MFFILIIIMYFALALVYFDQSPFWILLPGFGGIVLNKIAQSKLRNYYLGLGYLRISNIPVALANFKSFIQDITEHPAKLRWQFLATTNTLFSYLEMARFYKGVCQFDLKETDEAKKSFKELLAEREDFVECYLNLAGIAIKEGNKEDAIEWLTKAKPYVNKKFQKVVREAPFMKEVIEDARIKELLDMKPKTNRRKIIEWIIIAILATALILLIVYLKMRG